MKILPVNSFNYVANIPAKKVELREKEYGTPKYSSVPLNLHKNQISFGRSWCEHKSWGATLNPNGTVNFKFYTFDDTKRVFVEVLKKPKKSDETDNIDSRGFMVNRGGCWDYDKSKEVTEITPIDDRSEIFELERKQGDGGEFFQKWNMKGLKPSQLYRFIVVDKENDTNVVKDPYSKEQKQVKSWSTIHDPGTYKWSSAEQAWQDGKNPARISRLGGNNSPNSNLKSVGALRIMEINIPTFTKEGTFASAKEGIKEIADKNLANTIELCPVENCFSKQWGYDGVDKFAINERLGTNEELKELIDYTHQLGLNLIIDMVPNHVGPDGDTLRKAGPYESGDNDFGSAINYEGKGGRYVRDWMANAALHWIDEYHVDGLRLDMTKPYFMGSDFALKQINAEVNAHFPHAFTIAEDGRDGDQGKERVMAPIHQGDSHEQYIIGHIDDKIGTGAVPQKIGFNSEWDFALFHNIKQGLYYTQYFDIKAFDQVLKDSVTRVGYPISHDEQGNESGASGVTQAAVARLGMIDKVGSGGETERAHRAAHATQGLLEDYATGRMQKMDDSAWRSRVRGLGITQHISKEDVENAYKWGIDRVKLGMSIPWTVPGPKMVFQGYQKGSLDYFKAFRDFSNVLNPNDKEAAANKRAFDKEKGYDTSMAAAYKDNNLARIKYNAQALDTMSKVEKYFAALNNLVDENPALQDGTIVKNSSVVHEGSLVHAIHSKKGENEIFAIKNFKDVGYSLSNGQNGYSIPFPQGVWQEVLNSDRSEHGGSGEFVNARSVQGDGNRAIRLAPSGVSVFKRIG